MSKRVLFVCSLILLLGLLAGWEMISALVDRRVSINVGVVLIPVAIGLFLGMPVARGVATVVFCMAYTVIAIILLMSLVAGSSAEVRLFGTVIPFQTPFPVLFVGGAMIGSLLGLIHWMLYSQPFEDHLN